LAGPAHVVAERGELGPRDDEDQWRAWQLDLPPRKRIQLTQPR
jgi:hypothetical protein